MIDRHNVVHTFVEDQLVAIAGEIPHLLAPADFERERFILCEVSIADVFRQTLSLMQAKQV